MPTSSFLILLLITPQCSSSSSSSFAWRMTVMARCNSMVDLLPRSLSFSSWWIHPASRVKSLDDRDEAHKRHPFHRSQTNPIGLYSALLRYIPFSVGCLSVIRCNFCNAITWPPFYPTEPDNKQMLLQWELMTIDSVCGFSSAKICFVFFRRGFRAVVIEP